jgi:acetylornithine deacetylase/succinyl-diaminopimelate desuccinylase-like protein
MTGRLRTLGFEIQPLRFGSVENIWARHGREDGPVFCFAGHTDQVRRRGAGGAARAGRLVPGGRAL